MKRIFSAIVTLVLVSSFQMKADEGMWLLPYLEKFNINAMQEKGCRLSAEDIYSINSSSLKDAIVHFGGGCTGEIISKEGLLITNHHCGYGTIQKLSTPENNYLEDGFWAMYRDQEIPAPGLTVTFLEYMQDVTDLINENKATKEQLREKAEKENPGCKASVHSYYNNNVHYLAVYKEYTDIRFVGAPPASLGKFGGETDNWMWPRHTCDFSMFRVYADKNNNPADYSKDNVPYTPKRSLTISAKGVNEGDFTFIMGYPGRTQRFQTAAQLQTMLERNAIMVEARTVRQAIMKKAMNSSPVTRLQYASKYASSSNGWKKWQGMQLAFDNLDIIGKELLKEQQFTEWINADPERVKKYGNALETIAKATEASREATVQSALMSNTLMNIGPVQNVSTFYRTFNSCKKNGEKHLTCAIEGMKAAQAPFKDYNVELEKEIAVAMLEFYREKVNPEFYPNKAIKNFATADLAAYVDDLFAKSAFATQEALEKALVKPGKEMHKDPALVLYKELRDIYWKMYEPITKNSKALEEGSKQFAAGLLEWKEGEPSYPDANSTMRLTYGQCLSYSPKDAVIYRHYTTLDGVIAKEDPDNYEFRVPEKLKALYKMRRQSEYADPIDGKIHTCFLTNNDITGGNSGSPVLDADGQLIGLAFDGNWESMSSDVMFEPDLQRCICVDIRYVLFIIDEFGGAQNLIDEMTIVK